MISSQEFKPKIAFFTLNEGFCKYYRIQYPGEALEEQGLAEVRIINPSDDRLFMENVIWGDILVFQYAATQEHIIKFAELFESQKIPKVIVADFDDDYYHIDPTNTTYRYWGTEDYSFKGKQIWKDGVDGFHIKDNKKQLELMTKAIKACDIVTVTTKELADRYSKHNKNVQILKNYIQPNVMPEKRVDKKNRDVVTIGWQGSDSHAGDLASVMKTLEQIKKMYGNKVKFKFMGSYLAKNLYKYVDGEFIPWVKPHMFYERFSKLDFDIGLIVVNDTKFNRAKSNIKWLEYSYYGIPTVASGVPPYSITMFHGKDCLMYKHANQLKRSLCALIDDPILRMTLAKTAKDHVLKYYDINVYAKKWIDIYKQEYFRKKKKLGIV